MLTKKCTLLFLLVLAFFASDTNCFAQKKKKSGTLITPSSSDIITEDYYGDNSIRYEDYTYKKYIRTVQLYDESFELSQPVLNLELQERLKLSFDDLDADLKNYSYTLIHCNGNWEPSDLQPAEYIDGFADNLITDYRYSFNTLQKFTHYNAVFPNNSTRITKSGNYILKVYLDGDPLNIAITRRFMVCQNRIMIESRVLQASIIEDRNYKHELDFIINHSGYPITNPFGDLKIVITQNNRWDNAKTNFKPVFVKDMELVYDYDQENVFTAGNEFRHFDMKSIRYHSERIYTINKDSAGNHVILHSDEKRTFKRYYTYSDINGKFLVKVQEGTNSEVEADYCYVTFFLPYDAPLTDGNLYVFGAFNAWKYNRENLMRYNQKRFGYECTLYLKQGYYNYEYAFLKDGETAADNTLIEGMHYETENDYTIYVYHRQQGTFYDQLIGVKRLNSMRSY
ncbi:MAG: type IX secretion system plug protein [Bacteroidota bacterium]